MSAWGQVDAPGGGRSVPVPAASSVKAQAPTAVASFPDVVEQKPQRTRGPTHDLLDSNPYGGELESSTTDTSGQFSNMISAQQAYSAASQVITTVNKMFDTLISSMR